MAEHFDGNATARATDTQGAVDKKVYDPRSWGREAELAIGKRIVEVSETLGLAGRTLYETEQ